MDFWAHPHCSASDQALARRSFYWDHGTGIYYWHKVKNGSVVPLAGKDFEEGHFTKIGNGGYKRTTPVRNGSDAERNMSEEIKENFDLKSACLKLCIEHFLHY